MRSKSIVLFLSACSYLFLASSCGPVDEKSNEHENNIVNTEDAPGVDGQAAVAYPSSGIRDTRVGERNMLGNPDLNQNRKMVAPPPGPYNYSGALFPVDAYKQGNCCCNPNEQVLDDPCHLLYNTAVRQYNPAMFIANPPAYRNVYMNLPYRLP